MSQAPLALQKSKISGLSKSAEHKSAKPQGLGREESTHYKATALSTTQIVLRSSENTILVSDFLFVKDVVIQLELHICQFYEDKTE